MSKSQGKPRHILVGERDGRQVFLWCLPDEYFDGIRFDDFEVMVFGCSFERMQVLLSHLQWSQEFRPEFSTVKTLRIASLL